MYCAPMTEGNFLWLLIVVTTAIGNLISVFVNLRRKPPMVEELYRDFVRKSEHETQVKSYADRISALETHNDNVHAELFGLIRDTQKQIMDMMSQNHAAIQADLKVFERALGRLEGTKTR